MDLSPGYREAPAAGLACVWAAVAGPRSRTTRVLPDACVDVIWRQGSGAFVAGPDTSAELTTSDADEVLIGARFAPGTGAAALGLPLHALRDQRVPLADVDRTLHDALAPDLEPVQAAAILAGLGDHRRETRAMRALLTDAAPDPLVGAVVTALQHPRRRIATLAGDIGLSERQLRRRCEAAVGYGPKQLQRVLRLQAFLAAVETTDPGDGLMRLALDAGYSDQSHLTTDVRRLTGLTPGALLRERAGKP